MMSMATSLQKATANDKLANALRDYCDYFAEETKMDDMLQTQVQNTNNSHCRNIEQTSQSTINKSNVAFFSRRHR